MRNRTAHTSQIPDAEMEIIKAENELEELIPIYVLNKSEMDSYKKICDDANKRIKDLMLKSDHKTYTVNDIKVTRSIENRESFDEEKLLTVLKRYGITEAVKTREYVDMTALENYLYKNEVDEDIIKDLDKCSHTTEIVKLLVKRIK
jgi:hypothetical protein